MRNNLMEQDYIIRTMASKYDIFEIKSIARNLGISHTEFYSDQYNMQQLSEKFITRVYQLSKQNDLKSIILKDENLKRENFFENFSDLSYNDETTSNITADKFGKFFTALLENLDLLEEKNFDESELFDPVEFEEKMRKKAKLSEDTVKAGLKIKPDISVLRRKANALDYRKYDRLLQKIGRIYRHEICDKYPEDEFSANRRFTYLFNYIMENVPKHIIENDDLVDANVEGLIFDTIAHCLIFNK